MRPGTPGSRLVVQLALLLAVIAAGYSVVAPPASVAATTACGTNTDLSGLVGRAHPVILVHGWTGKPMAATRDLLEKLPDHAGRQYLLFDYSRASTSWPDAPAISRCLAQYIADVSKTNKARGGDGMVYLVAHSMGGLAIRFALAPGTGDPSVVDDVGGVVSIDTPYAGSMWGNSFVSWLASAKTHPMQALGTSGYPVTGASAWRCLATLGGRLAVNGCAVTPGLPDRIPLTQLAGDLSVERSLFGFHAYTFDLGGDGIVARTSQWGSVGADHKPVAGQVDDQQVQCTMSADKLLDAATGVLSNAMADSFLLDLYQDKAAQLSPDPGTVTAVVSTLARISGAACSHSGMTSNPEAVAKVDASLTTMIARQAGLTHSADLINAPIPPSCRHRAARLKGYQLQFGQNATGEDRGFAQLLVKQAVYGDVTGDGISDAVVPLLCSAGGVSWPELLLVYGPGLRLEGTVDLGDSPVAQEHVDVDKLSLVGQGPPTVRVAFRSYEGAGFGTGTYSGVLGWASGRPTFSSGDALTVDYGDHADDSLGIGYGLINEPSDVDTWLVGVPPDFAAFIRSEWQRTSEASAGICDNTARVDVDRYSHLGFASGQEGACGGAASIWAKVDGSWRNIYGYQEGPYCTSATALQKRAFYVLGIGCYATSTSDTFVDRGAWPSSGQ